MIKFLLLLSLSALPSPTHLKKGDPAPFDGQLLPGLTAATLLKNATHCPKEIKMAVTATAAAWKAKLDSCENRIVITSSAAAARIVSWEDKHEEWVKQDADLKARIVTAEEARDSAQIWAYVGWGGVLAATITAVALGMSK